MRRIILPLLLLLSSGCVFAQKLDSLLDIQRKADPQEKAYVQFDKNYYNAGETIWFKAYLFAGSDPSEVSKSFYAELIDEQGNLLSQRTAPIILAGASGSFGIDSNFRKQVVYFRGYTISEMNSDTSFLFTKALRILSSKTTAAKTTTSSAPSVLRFLPEGGDWITGIPGRIGFIATNGQELPVAITGSIVDDKGIKVTELKTLHDGMGIFSLTPEEGKTYTANWKDENGKTYTTPLPAPKPQGINLKITDEANGNKRFTLFRSNGTPNEMKQLYVAATMNQRLAFEARINIENKVSATGVFPVNDLSSGILQITVFDSNHKPLAERITFVNNHDFELDGDAFLALKNFTRRGLNEVEVIMSDTLPANLSLSITDADLNESNRLDDNIVSRMLLTGDLRGKITNPYYYFYSNDDSVATYLDLVMLTHGWRRFNWDNVWAGKTTTPKWKESNYLTLNGQLTGLVPGSISPDLQLVGILQTSDSATSIVTLPVDRRGKIFTEGLLFYDKAKLFFNFNKKNLSFDKSMLIVDNGLRKGYQKVMVDTTLKKEIMDLYPETIANNIKTNKMFLQAMKQIANSKMMENITVTAKVKTPKEKMEEKYVSGLFAGDANSFDLVNDPFAASSVDIFQYLQGKVAGLQISTGAGAPSLSWRGGTPALYLNEMQVDANVLSSTPVSNIAYIKVFRPGESIVSGGGGGVIAVYTRKGGDAQPNANAKGLNYVQLMGYSPVKEFYSPDYSTFSERDAYDDVRTTLYWNPSMIMDKSRKHLRLKFYNNDITKRFRLVMEGLNAAGKVIHVEKEISH